MKIPLYYSALVQNNFISQQRGQCKPCSAHHFCSDKLRVGGNAAVNGGRDFPYLAVALAGIHLGRRATGVPNDL